MNVSEIRDRVLEISHDEATPDTNLKTKAMQWVNSAYHELVDECMPYLGRYIETTETINIVNGEGQASGDVYRVIKAVDESNGNVLSETSYSKILAIDPLMETKGKPTDFWLDGNYIKLHPIADISLKLLYTPTVTDLVEIGDESSILLPRQFHYALIWGGLVWSAIYERGFATKSDIAMFQKKWEEAKRSVKLSLINTPENELRVKPF